MNIEIFIIELYCRIEKSLAGIKLRSRGFPPKLTDAELGPESCAKSHA
jgi:hypothetical protein